MATSAVTVMTLRSRLDKPGRSHISPNRTFSVRSASFGATSPILSLVVGSCLSSRMDSPGVLYLFGLEQITSLELLACKSLDHSAECVSQLLLWTRFRWNHARHAVVDRKLAVDLARMLDDAKAQIAKANLFFICVSGD